MATTKRRLNRAIEEIALKSHVYWCVTVFESSIFNLNLKIGFSVELRSRNLHQLCPNMSLHLDMVYSSAILGSISIYSITRHAVHTAISVCNF